MSLFRMLGNLGNLARIQEEIQRVTEELAQEHFEGRAGGDLVVVTVNGAQQLVSCTIDPKLVAEYDRELMEDLIVTAVNEALAVTKRRSLEIMQKKLGERLNLPELAGVLSNFMPKA